MFKTRGGSQRPFEQCKKKNSTIGRGRLPLPDKIGVSRPDPRDEQKPVWQVAKRIKVIFHSKFWLDPTKDFKC